MCKCSNAVTNVVELCLIELDLFDVNIILLLLLLLFFLCVCLHTFSVRGSSQGKVISSVCRVAMKMSLMLRRSMILHVAVGLSESFYFTRGLTDFIFYFSCACCKPYHFVIITFFYM